MDVEAPPVLYAPAGHPDAHCIVRAVAVLYVPAAHAVHVGVEAAVVLNDPIGHAAVH